MAANEVARTRRVSVRILAFVPLMSASGFVGATHLLLAYGAVHRRAEASRAGAACVAAVVREYHEFCCDRCEYCRQILGDKTTQHPFQRETYYTDVRCLLCLKRFSSCAAQPRFGLLGDGRGGARFMAYMTDPCLVQRWAGECSGAEERDEALDMIAGASAAGHDRAVRLFNQSYNNDRLSSIFYRLCDDCKGVDVAFVSPALARMDTNLVLMTRGHRAAGLPPPVARIPGFA